MPLSATIPHTRTLGAIPVDGGVQFRVWAPRSRTAAVRIDNDGRTIAMQKDEDGYFSLFVADLPVGTLYRFLLDGHNLFPDPASRFQPQGVHGPSQVVDPAAFDWSDAGWKGISKKDLVFYELHVGTFSPEGTFDGLRGKLPYLRDLGITAVELMPVADWPGRRNWGYDHAALFAPSRAYGSPDSLRRLVDTAHAMGLAVFHDVIYNHLGPDGAYANAYGPMYSAGHQTPWGSAINLDDEESDGVRRFFIENALHWLEEYHFDGLRLDATDCLIDESPTHFLRELAEHAHAVSDGPHRYLFAEDHRNENVLVMDRDVNGYGLDGVWVDNFHHLVRNLIAGDHEGYYADFKNSTMAEVALTINRGWFFDDVRVSPTRGAPRGTSPANIQPQHCVFCIQNHDQIGNRPLGNRLTDDVSLPVFRAVSALLLWVPELPLLFQGQEWAASTPFQFFTDHHPALGRKVTEGRRNEFRHFTGFSGDVPDPQDEATFERSRLSWDEVQHGPRSGMLRLYRRLLHERRELAPHVEAEARGEHCILLRRGERILAVSVRGEEHLKVPEGARVIWHTEEAGYSDDPRAPELTGSTLFFPVAAAAILSR